jgi:hypothetical protein
MYLHVTRPNSRKTRHSASSTPTASPMKGVTNLLNYAFCGKIKDGDRYGKRTQRDERSWYDAICFGSSSDVCFIPDDVTNGAIRKLLPRGWPYPFLPSLSF